MLMRLKINGFQIISDVMKIEDMINRQLAKSYCLEIRSPKTVINVNLNFIRVQTIDILQKNDDDFLTNINIQHTCKQSIK